MFYRLNPFHDKPGHKASMFDLAKATSLRLINGDRWGDDYIVAPTDADEQKVVEEIMNEAGIFYEKVNTLPPHLSWHMI